jgi:hypothetical protein
VNSRFGIAAAAALLTLSGIAAQAQGSLPCSTNELPLVAERTFKDFFTSGDTLMAMAREARHIVRQRSNARHGVLRDKRMCERLRTAALRNLGFESHGDMDADDAQPQRDRAHAENGSPVHPSIPGLTRNIEISMFEFGDYLGAWVHIPPPDGAVLRSRSVTLQLFRRSDLRYIADWDY